MVYVLLADGCEEIEALCPVDILRRGGCEVRTVGITGKYVCGAHKIRIAADILPDEVGEDIELLVLPGGIPGADYIDASPFTDKFIESTKRSGGRIAAICAAPYVLGKRNLLVGKKATCYPNDKFISKLNGAEYVDKPVVTDENITTAKGMGVALQFSLELLKLLKGEQVAESVASSAFII